MLTASLVVSDRCAPAAFALFVTPATSHLEARDVEGRDHGKLPRGSGRAPAWKRGRRVPEQPRRKPCTLPS